MNESYNETISCANGMELCKLPNRLVARKGQSSAAATPFHRLFCGGRSPPLDLALKGTRNSFSLSRTIHLHRTTLSCPIKVYYMISLGDGIHFRFPDCANLRLNCPLTNLASKRQKKIAFLETMPRRQGHRIFLAASCGTRPSSPGDRSGQALREGTKATRELSSSAI